MSQDRSRDPGHEQGVVHRCGDDDLATQVDGLALMSTVQTWASDQQVPLNATIEITQRCNIRCLHCYNFDRDQPLHKESCAELSPELSTPEILAAISALHDAGCLFLSITGGEALLHPDLFQFLDHTAHLNLAVQLLTNGVLLRPGVAGQLAKYPNLLKVSVSLYGASAEVHDAITQAPGSFDRTWAGIERMRGLGIAVRLKFIVMRGNAHEVEQMMERAQGRGFIYGIDLTVTARHDGTRTSLATRVDDQQLLSLCRGPLRPLLLKGKKREFTGTQFSCNCARGNCAITARGDVQPCIAVPMVAGNIRQQSFREIWDNAPVFKMIRGLQMEDYGQCAPCAHKSWCTRERGAAYTYSGSYTGVDPLVCTKAEIAHELADQARAQAAAASEESEGRSSRTIHVE